MCSDFCDVRSTQFQTLGSGGALRVPQVPPIWGRLAGGASVLYHRFGVNSLAAPAFNEAALRLPAAVDSLAALAFNKAGDARARVCSPRSSCDRGPGDARAWAAARVAAAIRGCAGGLTTHRLQLPTECERGRTNSPGLSARAPRRSECVAGEATA